VCVCVVCGVRARARACVCVLGRGVGKGENEWFVKTLANGLGHVIICSTEMVLIQLAWYLNSLYFYSLDKLI